MAPIPLPTIQQLLRSCEILFGADLRATREFLDYLQLSGLKSAYRKKVFETHPDRLRLVDRNSRRQTGESFHAVQEAYRNLLAFLEWREGMPSSRQAESATVPRRGADGVASGRQHLRRFSVQAEYGERVIITDSDRFYRGPMPNRGLLFGHFLYYAGLTNWRTIVRVLAWQRGGRPRLGEIGHRLGLLNHGDIDAILRSRQPLQRFGERAVQEGVLSERQRQYLLARQHLLQKRFGEILLEKQLVSRDELQELLYWFRRHHAELERGGK